MDYTDKIKGPFLGVNINQLLWGSSKSFTPAASLRHAYMNRPRRETPFNFILLSAYSIFIHF